MGFLISIHLGFSLPVLLLALRRQPLPGPARGRPTRARQHRERAALQERGRRRLHDGSGVRLVNGRVGVMTRVMQVQCLSDIMTITL